MAGIPPMAGFLAKLYVFNAAVHAHLTWLVVAGVLFSVVSAYYYLRLIKIMYFDPSLDNAAVLIVPKIWLAVTVLSAVSMVALLIHPQPVSDLVTWAAQTP